MRKMMAEAGLDPDPPRKKRSWRFWKRKEDSHLNPPAQRPADEDEIKRAEREDAPDTIERQRPATEEEIEQAEREEKDK
jgi:hypothetical protein